EEPAADGLPRHISCDHGAAGPRSQGADPPQPDARTLAAVIRGALAAAATPLVEGGDALDEEAFGPLADFLVRGRLDGVLALGTTGEGILLAPAERMRAAELFLEASD